MTLLRAFFLVAALGTGTILSAETAKEQGYLAPGEFNIGSVVEPAPRPGDPRYLADRRIFQKTRKLVGTPRWAMATQDAQYAVPALMRNFSCSVGVRLTPENAPRLAALVQRAAVDTGGQTYRAKEMFQRNRPFTIDRGPVCQPKADLYDKVHGRMSYDYPSGHATWGWTWALVLTAVAPDRAQQILARGRAYADSRFVCGAHNESAVEAGLLSASATMAIIATKGAYQAELADAKAEFAALRAGGTAVPEGCATETALIAERVMPKLDKNFGRDR